MKKVSFLLIPLILMVCVGCNGKHEHSFGDLFVSKDECWHTYVEGSDFDPDGLEISMKCKDCGEVKKVSYSLENDTSLSLEQTSVKATYKGKSLDIEIKVKTKYHVACIGDSLTYGHMWRDKAYPVYLASKVSDKYEVGNFSYNGLSITGYGGSFDDPNERYIVREEYKQSVAFAPDIFAIMLGTNDATGWAKAEPTFEEEYKTLLNSYIEQFPNAKFIMMVSPPVIQNTFSIPNDVIKESVNPIQRSLAEEYEFEVLDLREEFETHENYETDYLRPNDGVHFTEAAADYVAGRVWEIAQDLRF